MHRIGRAGRAGASGEAYTMITSKDGFVARELVTMLQKTRAGAPRDLMRIAYSGGGSDGGNRRWR